MRQHQGRRDPLDGDQLELTRLVRPTAESKELDNRG